MHCEAELSTCKTKGYIDVRFPYSKLAVAAIKSVPGARYIGGDVRDKHWHIPLDMSSCRALREAFDSIDIRPGLKSWAVQAKRNEEQLGSIATAETAELQRLPQVLPMLYRAIHVGPKGLQMSEAERDAAMLVDASYQAADVAYMALTGNCLNGNQPGLGKTIETIASIWEDGREVGNHLIICPANAIEAVWEDELLMWQAEVEELVGVFALVGTPKQRRETLSRFLRSDAPTRYLIVNPEMVRWTKSKTHEGPVTLPAKGDKQLKVACYCEDKQGHFHYDTKWPELHDTQWNTIIVDECHRNSIRNHRSVTSIFINKLVSAEGGRRVALSGTPMRKNGGSDLWGLLHWMRPDIFTSFWRFAETYFEIEDNGYGKKVLGLKHDAKDRLYKDLAPYIIRRTKAECLPWLPPKQFIEVWCDMGTKQARAYNEMLQEGYTELDDGEVVTTSILAERTRLRQFATSYCELRGDEVFPSLESCKVDALLEKLDEYDVLSGTNEAPHVVFTQSKRLCYLVAEHLRGLVVRTEVLSGDQNKPGERRALKNAFQAGDIDVLCIVTTAGGVALTLDAADTVHFLDETESPDDQEQAEDRAHRASRNHQVQIIQYRTRGTIDETIAWTNYEKQTSHRVILDERRGIRT